MYEFCVKSGSVVPQKSITTLQTSVVVNVYHTSLREPPLRSGHSSAAQVLSPVPLKGRTATTAFSQASLTGGVPQVVQLMLIENGPSCTPS